VPHVGAVLVGMVWYDYGMLFKAFGQRIKNCVAIIFICENIFYFHEENI